MLELATGPFGTTEHQNQLHSTVHRILGCDELSYRIPGYFTGSDSNE
jgi:hypothetical protein